MRVLCKKNYAVFKEGKHYEVISIISVFVKNDFIILLSNQSLYRFRLNKSLEYVEDYIGLNEIYFYDYFYSEKEERKIKLNKINLCEDPIISYNHIP